MEPTNIRVLVIDDNEIDREAVFRHLAQSFCVLEAKSGREGLELSKQSKPACVLLDYRLPDVEGMDLLREFVDQQIPVVMLTGQGGEQTAARAIKLGAEDYLSKSMLAKETLTHAISNAIDKFNLRRRLEQEQLDSAGFITFASDELKRPLARIREAAESIRPSPDSEAAAESILAEARQLDSLIDAMVEYAHAGREDSPLESVDLETCVEQAREVMLTELPDLTIRAGRMPLAPGRAGALTEVFQHLFRILARDAASQPLTVDVSSELRGEHYWEITVTNAVSPAAGDSALGLDCSIRDVGGLSLVTCARIIRRHGGKVWSQRVDGRTTICFTLPRS